MPKWYSSSSSLREVRVLFEASVLVYIWRIVQLYLLKQLGDRNHVTKFNWHIYNFEFKR